LLHCSFSAEKFEQLLLEFNIYLPGYFMGVVRWRSLRWIAK